MPDETKKKIAKIVSMILLVGTIIVSLIMMSLEKKQAQDANNGTQKKQLE